jgi:hypothetical protein
LPDNSKFQFIAQKQNTASSTVEVISRILIPMSPEEKEGQLVYLITSDPVIRALCIPVQWLLFPVNQTDLCLVSVICSYNPISYTHFSLFRFLPFSPFILGDWHPWILVTPLLL